MALSGSEQLMENEKFFHALKITNLHDNPFVYSKAPSHTAAQQVQEHSAGKCCALTCSTEPSLADKSLVLEQVRL